MTEIIPAIDLIDGKCVRLSQGDFTRQKAYGDPVDMALRFEDHGLERLHVVDLDGAREKRVVNHRILEKIASRTTLVIDAGGGLRSDEDVRIVFESGASMVTGGSVAVSNRSLFLGWLERYGPGRVLLGADFREGKIAISGWEENTSVDLMDFLAAYVDAGVETAICTDITLDGMLEGPSLESYRKIREELEGLRLVASGGIRTLEDIGKLEEAGLAGVILGKALYEGTIALKELKKYLLEKG
jgi:phosphoribosylformimino-5-aminoimidazole carboxamide ribotide isomerase